MEKIKQIKQKLINTTLAVIDFTDEHPIVSVIVLLTIVILVGKHLN